MKLTMIQSLIAFALFSNTAFASQSAVDYLSTQGINSRKSSLNLT